MDQTHVVVPGSDRVPMPGARALGAANQEEWVEVTIKLRRKADLPALDGRPKTPMTLTDLEAAHGASEEDVAAVEKALGKYGLQVIDSDAATRTVRMGGPVSEMEKAFQVKLIRYAHERGDYRGRVGALQVPSELKDIVEGVFGLDNRRVVKRRATAPRLSSLTAARAKTRPWFFPAELAAAYSFPAGDGAEQTIGILEFGGGYFPNDLATFCRTAGVPVANVLPISVDHAATDQHDGAEDEVMLDIEVIAGACPQAKIPVYFSSFTEKGWVDILDAAVHDAENKPTVLSVSWGDAEDHASWSRQGIREVNQALHEAALLGITVCVASGDDGSDDQVGDGHAHVDFPCSSPYALAVGGTILRKQADGFSEKAWKDGDGLRKDGGGSTGGGVSTVFDRPSWQKVSVASVNPGGKAGRCVPDVAANASAHTGYFMVVDGKAMVNGGTSASAPLWAALVARINAALQGKRAGYITPVLYQSSGSSTVGGQACKDIVSGNNSTAAVGGYEAGPGYDAVCGWGAPNGNKLLAALKPLV